jgi:cytochrome c
MDSFELNKIAGALLGTLLFVMGLGMLGDVIFAPHKPVVAG